MILPVLVADGQAQGNSANGLSIAFEERTGDDALLSQSREQVK